MKILFVSSVADTAGGAERSLLELAGTLREHGHQLSLAVWRDGDVAAAFRPLGQAFYFDRRNDPASPLGGATTRFPALRPLVRRANDVRLALRPVGREARWLAAVARETNADLLHTNCDLSPPAAARAARMAGIPWVAHVRDLTRSWLHPRTARALRAADRMVAPSAFLAGHLRERGVDPVVIPNPVSDAELQRSIQPGDRARIRAELGVDGHAFLVGVVGRLDEQKGTLDVVEAARRLEERGDRRTRFVLAGSGRPSFEARLRRAIEDAGVGERIRLLGHRTDVGHWLPTLDAVAVPSTAEAFGRVVVEAMRAGVPVVAYRDGAVPELLEDGRTGVLVPAGDVGALAEALGSLAADPCRARRLGDATRSAATRYDPDGVAAQMEQLYQSLLED